MKDLIQEGRKIQETFKKKTLNEETFYAKMKKMNPGWSKEQTLSNFEDEYDDEFFSDDYKEHQEYLQDAEKWFDEMDSKSPTVKVGDIVDVWMKSVQSKGVGKIVKETSMEGKYGFMGDVVPNKIPAWVIECYTNKPGFEEQKKTLNVKGKTYYYIGTLTYPQYLEGSEKAFKKNVG